MSSLLEKAIIDAAALKESALKNAENLVIEKYSKEVKDAMSRLLEQEDPFGLEEDPLGAPGDTNEDPFADENMIAPEDELGGDVAGLDTPEDPMSDDPAATEDGDLEQFMNQIPTGFDPDFGDPDDEIINIKLDSLRAEMPDEDVGVFGGDDELDPNELGIDIEDDEGEDEDVDLDFGSADFDATPSPDAATASPDLGGISPEMVAEVLSELGLEDEDIDLEELEEAVRVDFEPQKSGWAGTPESVMREYESMLLAREQDSKVKEENQELRKAVAALQKENKTLTSAANKIVAQNEKYTTTLEALQEKLETMNVSNAKLLYINRALENASLNERQKEKLVESISKAETVQEAKIIFDTLQETVASSPAEKRNTSLNEAVSRRSTLLVSARNEQKKTNVNPAFERLQKLAGITIKT